MVCLGSLPAAPDQRVMPQERLAAEILQRLGVAYTVIYLLFSCSEG